MQRIIPEKDLSTILPLVQLPGRYVGGEIGTVKEYNRDDFHIGICFPDIYEIGMSNNAIKILYSELNNITGVSCERVFFPAADFISYLKKDNIPLYTLESGIPLNQLDLLAISVGYEMSATNILSVLELGNIPILNHERQSADPIIIAGGPGITNPIPLGSFIDVVYIGEAEYNFFNLINKLSVLAKKNGSRDDLLELIRSNEYIWFKNKKTVTRRSIQVDFGQNFQSDDKTIVPSIKTVQDHGVVEIMRGCPTGCRFCHAGYFYRPYREKKIEIIKQEVNRLIYKGGYREITLSSLSTGDYSCLDLLMEQLNFEYKNKNVSFALPSLRINSFTLSLLENIGSVRKSGLTFAVETPYEAGQRAFNKQVFLNKTIEILLEAKKRGWKKAKFYFMLGFPWIETKNEADLITSFIEDVYNKVKIQLNVNIGTFVPKPHTPFQWFPQLPVEEAEASLLSIKKNVRQKNIKINYRSPFLSFLEGLVSRGDERVGSLIHAAYEKGAVMDAWEEYCRIDIWKDVINKANWDVVKEICKEHNVSDILPWNLIDMGVRKQYLKNENERASRNELTNKCNISCEHNCGICKDGCTPLIQSQNSDNKKLIVKAECQETSQQEYYYLVEYSKSGKATFLSHINVMTIFERAIQRSEVHISYTQGFNPKPRLEFAQPLSLGIESNCEICGFKTHSFYNPIILKNYLNKNMPSGIAINEISLLNYFNNIGSKKKSLMSLYRGSRYKISSKTGNIEALIKIYNKMRTIATNKNTLFINNDSMVIEIRQNIENADNSNETCKNMSLNNYIDLVMERNQFYADFIVKRVALYAEKHGDEIVGYFAL